MKKILLLLDGPGHNIHIRGEYEFNHLYSVLSNITRGPSSGHYVFGICADFITAYTHIYMLIDLINHLFPDKFIIRTDIWHPKYTEYCLPHTVSSYGPDDNERYPLYLDGIEIKL